MTSSRYRHWSVTWNNYTEDDVSKLQCLPGGALPDGAAYVVVGKEVGKLGTRHLQIGISYPNPRRIKSIQSFFDDRAHIEVARNPASLYKYCKKDGDSWELGTPPVIGSPGKRTDLEALGDAIRAGETDRKRLREIFPAVCAKYPNFVRDVIHDQLIPPPVIPHPLYSWQTDLLKDLLVPDPDPRKVIFIVDYTGDEGKSWFVDYYQSIYADSIDLLPGKKADMVYAFLDDLNPSTRVFFLDCPRSKQGDFIQYDFLEELKNGKTLNSKYTSRRLRFKPLHVVVMMNEYPDQTKLSLDRFDIRELNDAPLPIPNDPLNHDYTPKFN